MSLFIGYFPSNGSSLNVSPGPAASALSGNLLEMCILKPQSKFTQSELLRVGPSCLCFKQTPQVILMHMDI